ncbi:hypothetical protein AOQ84DRAFT_431442 [Glonium stellatum]|uniref:Heterokaryon incompatibility domain-containing protein n=1 Tax=Glonium stellatum TaxID=574774 RepID=A0A8E2F219_9PEZI|nr:hypothetical protein AOQ84DRAFT_431442 [Glonium stellatum]
MAKPNQPPAYREKPTAERRERHGPRKEPSSPTSDKPQTVEERILQAAKKSKLLSYDKLKEGEVRILIIHPAEDPKAEILVALETLSFEDLSESYEFEALSYHRGDDDATHPIFIQEDGIPQPKSLYNVHDILANCRRLYVKPNLHKALRHFRRKDMPIALWVDAICINQPDEEEKKLQVTMMAQLYTQADRVCIWLGSADAGGRTDKAMLFIKEIVKEHELDKLIKPKDAASWSDLVYLMRSSWFSCRWVIQELALAKDATVHCGEKEVHWRDFADAISLFVLHFEQIRKLFQGKPEFALEYNVITELDPLGAKILVDEISNTFLKNEDGTLYEPLKGLETLVSSLSTFDTSDPRDTIHALLNIAKETSPLSSVAPARAKSENPPPKPSYSNDLLEVYTGFVKWVINEHKSLDIICRQWALPPRKEKDANSNYDKPVVLPSWIQVVANSTYGKQEEGHGRKNGDSFVGLPDAKFYNASHDESAKARFGIDTNKRDSSMYVKGFVVGRVTWRTDPIPDGVISQKALQKLGWIGNDDEVDTVPDKVWRTLVADRGPDGRNPPSWYHRACLRCLVQDTPNGHINTHKLLSGEPPKIIKDYLKRVQAVTWNRVVLEASSEDGKETFVGIGPPGTEFEDIVCILFGCSVPCILRRCEIDGDKQGGYKLVGESFVYGRMDGEAVTGITADELRAKTKEFRIV